MARCFPLFILFLATACLIPCIGHAADNIPTSYSEANPHGKPLPELAREMEKRYAGRTPKLWGESLPGIVTRMGFPNTPAAAGSAPTHVAALTLDACEGSIDMRIVTLLREHSVPAALFVTSRWLGNNREIAAELAADPLFSLECHGARHKPASVNGRHAYGIAGTRTITALVAEVEKNARDITVVTGVRPRWYRSGTAHYDEIAVAVINDLGLEVAGYTVSADAGATLPAAKVARLLIGAPNNAIILCHINHPTSETYGGLAKAIPAMRQAGVSFVRLPF